MPTTPLLQPAGARFDPNKLNWLGSTNRETQVTYVWHTAPVQKLERPQDHGADRRRAGARLDPVRFPDARQALFGTKFKVITGYESTPKIHLAMERGEVQGNGATNWSTLKALNSNWLDGEEDPDHGAVGAARSIPSCRTCRWCSTSPRREADEAGARLALARLEYGRPFFLPPNVPPERVEALRRAFDAT